jgi:hypothetical protein
MKAGGAESKIYILRLLVMVVLVTGRVDMNRGETRPVN